MPDEGSRRVISSPPPRAQHRIPYGQDPFQFGDLWLPEAPGPHPVLIFIHGGFWRALYGLEHAGFLCAAFAGSGIATWSVEYRRLGNPGGGWTGTFQDVAQGVAHVRSLAREHPLALERAALMGHSAGGHLALWYAGAGRIPRGDPLHVADPLPLQAVVALAGVSDLRRAWELGLSERVVEQLLEGAPQRVPERYAAASPEELLPLGMRQVLVHGTEDHIVPLELSEGYHAAALAQGDPVTLLRLPGLGHFEPIDPQSAAWPHVHGAVSQVLCA